MKQNASQYTDLLHEVIIAGMQQKGMIVTCSNRRRSSPGKNNIYCALVVTVTCLQTPSLLAWEMPNGRWRAWHIQCVQALQAYPAGGLSQTSMLHALTMTGQQAGMQMARAGAGDAGAGEGRACVAKGGEGAPDGHEGTQQPEGPHESHGS